MLVDSSAIRAIDYDRGLRRLQVTFVSGDRYVYRGVSGEVHRAFCEAESKGRFFQMRIRDRYPYARLN
jgi:lysyl-tRNA synthetase class 2